MQVEPEPPPLSVDILVRHGPSEQVPSPLVHHVGEWEECQLVQSDVEEVAEVVFRDFPAIDQDSWCWFCVRRGQKTEPLYYTKV